MEINSPSLYPGGTTGRYLVNFLPEAAPHASQVLEEAVGLSSIPSTAATMSAELRGTDAIVFEQLGCALLPALPNQAHELGVAAMAHEAVTSFEPERIVYALEFQLGLGPPPMTDFAWRSSTLGSGGARSNDYLRGFSDAAQHLAAGVGAGRPAFSAPLAGASTFDESRATWGVQATGAASSSFNGQGVGVAVLDTGVDAQHPDLAGRDLTAESFVEGEDPQDGNGHGTHCIGTACGSQAAGIAPRYGIAPGAAIYAGKVLSNAGRGADGDILAGIEAAIAHDCRVVSMSLGAPTVAGTPHSPAFENAARLAAERGMLIIAAAGNDSRRELGMTRPVSHPANCPSIMAVAAVDPQLGVAPFSNQGTDPAGGQIDIAGPGVDVYSSAPMPARYQRLNGTSMATPHVAGVAALLGQENPQASATELAALLGRRSKRLAASSLDVGAGLVQAP